MFSLQSPWSSLLPCAVAQMLKADVYRGRHSPVHNEHVLSLHRACDLARCELLLIECVFGYSVHMSTGEEHPSHWKSP